LIQKTFSGISPRTDGLLDEVVDGAWYKRTFEECKAIAGNEEFLVLGIILYCDKTGTDVYQRAGLEPLSFSFSSFNRNADIIHNLGGFLVISSFGNEIKCLQDKVKTWSCLKRPTLMQLSCMSFKNCTVLEAKSRKGITYQRVDLYW